MVAPRSFVTNPHPATAPVSDSGDPSRSYPLGRWSREGFRFHGPEAQRQWHSDAFDQGVHHANWHLGRKLSPEETELVDIGVPKQHDHYQGPDGARYQITPAAQEDGRIAALRTAHLAAVPSFERGQSLCSITPPPAPRQNRRRSP